MKWQDILALVVRVLLAGGAAYLGTTAGADPAAAATVGTALGVLGKH